MSIEREQSEDLYNEQLRKRLEEKYNLNLDILSGDVGEKTYWDLREYFTKEIEQDNLLIRTDNATMWESKELCEDEYQYAEILESAIGHPCQYAANSTSNLENNIIQ